MPALTIDNQAVPFQPGDTVLAAARAAGIDIPALCYLPGRPPQTSCYLCVVRVNGGARLVPSCATAAVDGMVVESDSLDVRDARRTAIELLLSDHLGDCVGPCQSVCPAHMDIPDMVRDIAAGRFREALVTVKESIALPAALGRICPELCEKGCRRSSAGGPVAVCSLKRFVADVDLASDEPYVPPLAPPTGQRIAIAGAGPAGLAAAYYLLQAGHAVTLYDDHALPGGALRYAVPEERLPRAVLDAEIAIVQRMGADFQGNARVGGDIALQDLQDEYDAVLIATGPVTPETTPDDRLALGSQGVRVDRASMATNLAAVFVAGSAIIPARHAVRAVADGRAAAQAIHAFLGSDAHAAESKEFSVHIGRLEPDEVQPFLQVAGRHERVTAAGGAPAGFTAEEAMREARRCLHCDCAKADSCRLRQYAAAYEANPLHYRGERRPFEQDTTHPEVVFESGKCIACGICVRIAAEAGERLGIGFVGRGFGVRTAAPFSASIAQGLRRTARQCAEACPTGALVLRDTAAGATD